MSSSVGQSRLVEFRRGLAQYLPKVRLATGGMAEVWRGEARFADGHMEQVAIKRVLPALATNTLYRRMLEDEARLGMLLKHRNIVRVYDAREVRGTYIIVMELVEGPSLRDILADLASRRGRLSVAAAAYVVRELARALEHAHESFDEMGRSLNIIHRDVSPHNVLISSDAKVKLMDFGLANASANLAERDPGMIGGKFGYLAPELVLRQQSSALIDIFALGVMLWECLAGRRLFQAKDDQETVKNVVACNVPRIQGVNDQVSDDLQTVLDNMLARDPAERYQSASELGADLDIVLSQLAAGIGARETSLAVHAYLQALASKRRVTTESGTLPVPTAPQVSRAPEGAEPVPRDTFLNELDTLANGQPPADKAAAPAVPLRSPVPRAGNGS